MLPTPVPQILTPFISQAPYFIQVTVNCYKLIRRSLGRLIYLRLYSFNLRDKTSKVINTTKRAVKALIPLKSLDQKVHHHQHISNTLLH